MAATDNRKITHRFGPTKRSLVLGSWKFSAIKQSNGRPLIYELIASCCHARISFLKMTSLDNDKPQLGPYPFYDPFTDSEPDEDIQERQNSVVQKSKILSRKAGSRLAATPSPTSFKEKLKRQEELKDNEIKTRMEALERKNYELTCKVKDRELNISQLQRQIHDQAAQLETAREALEAAKRAASDPMNILAEQKISELAKKSRKLYVALEREKAQNAQLSQAVQDLEQRNSSGKSITKSLKKANTNEESETDTEKSLRTNLNQCVRKLEHERAQGIAIKQELRNAHQIIALEVGNDVPLSSLLHGKGSWRGRAQQIVILKDKVNELTSALSRARLANDQESMRSVSRLSNHSLAASSADLKNRSMLKTMQVSRNATLRETQDELQELKARLEITKQQHSAARNRTVMLERQVKDLKANLMTVLEKSAFDDRIIASLKGRP